MKICNDKNKETMHLNYALLKFPMKTTYFFLLTFTKLYTTMDEVTEQKKFPSHATLLYPVFNQNTQYIFWET